MAVSDMINDIRDKKILILGFGREGKSTYRLLRKYMPDKELTVGDKNEIKIDDANVICRCGEDYLERLGDFDLVFKSPGIAFIGVKYPETTKITCQTEMFLRYSGRTCVGVTGTKGKSTTSTLIARMLSAAGLDCTLMGNIGVPVFDKFEESSGAIAVIELSSHQLEFMRVSPHIAVLTNIYQEHLDHYERGFAGYVEAKLNIARYQSAEDYFLCNASQGISDFINEASLLSHIIKVPVGGTSLTKSLKDVNKHLRGSHFLADITFAAQAASLLSADEASIVRAVKEYGGIPHRLEYVGTFGGAEYYNDAIATIPEATLRAVDALGNVGTLILGGLDRGIDYSDFIHSLSSLGLDAVICMPDTGEKIADSLEKLGCKSKIVRVSSMEEAVAAAERLTVRGKACLLSPAAASYNAYRDFEEKGNHFKSLVKKSLA